MSQFVAITGVADSLPQVITVKQQVHTDTPMGLSWGTLEIENDIESCGEAGRDVLVGVYELKKTMRVKATLVTEVTEQAP